MELWLGDDRVLEARQLAVVRQVHQQFLSSSYAQDLMP
jgi:hypothetical protein